MSPMHNTQLHADFSHRCVVDSNALTWHASPSPLVLDGTLSDEAGEYGPDTLQAPFSKYGCLLFVKLRHIDPPVALVSGPGGRLDGFANGRIWHSTHGHGALGTRNIFQPASPLWR